jgi:hypothetical protein
LGFFAFSVQICVKNKKKFEKRRGIWDRRFLSDYVIPQILRLQRKSVVICVHLWTTKKRATPGLDKIRGGLVVTFGERGVAASDTIAR